MTYYYMTDWSDDYLIGIENIDNQHKEFFSIAYQFYNECLADEGDECIHDTLKFFGNYARKHFKAEEAFMKIIEYPQLEKHIKLHMDFLDSYSDLMFEFKQSGATEKMVNKILSIVMDWIKAHIVDADGDYARHAKNNNWQM